MKRETWKEWVVWIRVDDVGKVVESPGMIRWGMNSSENKARRETG